MNPDSNDQDMLNRNNNLQGSQDELDLQTADLSETSVSQHQVQSPIQNNPSDLPVGEDASMKEASQMDGGNAGYSASNSVSMNDVIPAQSSTRHTNLPEDGNLNSLGSNSMSQNDSINQADSDFASLSDQETESVNYDSEMTSESPVVGYGGMGAPKSGGMNPLVLVSVILSVAFGVFALIASLIKFDGFSYLALGAGVLSVVLGSLVAIKSTGVMRALGAVGAILGLLGLIVTIYMIAVAPSENPISEDVVDSETIESSNKDLDQPNEIAEDYNGPTEDPFEFPSLDEISQKDFATAMTFHTIQGLIEDYMSTGNTPPGADQLNSIIESEMAKEGVTREQAGFVYSTNIDDLKPGYIIYQTGKSCVSESQKDLVDSDGAALLVTASTGAVSCADFKQGS